MDSVRHFEGQLREQHPALWDDVVQFVKQEALHSAQHEKWNRRIEVGWSLVPGSRDGGSGERVCLTRSLCAGSARRPSTATLCAVWKLRSRG